MVNPRYPNHNLDSYSLAGHGCVVAELEVPFSHVNTSTRDRYTTNKGQTNTLLEAWLEFPMHMHPSRYLWITRTEHTLALH
ncbi:hypothetical protein WAI453_000383 [Rhynchosporium graminicola]